MYISEYPTAQMSRGVLGEDIVTGVGGVFTVGGRLASSLEAYISRVYRATERISLLRWCSLSALGFSFMITYTGRISMMA